MNQNTCQFCIHYRQHYTFDRRKIFRVYCGHCTLGKARRKLPDAVACEHFFLSDPDEQAFATKEYLSKELLQYLLNLELLPTIENAPEMTAKDGTKL